MVIDPILASGTFTSIVGLLCNFVNEHRYQKQAIQFDDFLLWLKKCHHEPVIKYLETNQKANENLQNIFKTDNKILLDKIVQIDDLLIKISSKINGWSEVVESLSPNKSLSDQCISILRQLEKSGGSDFIEITAGAETLFYILDKNKYIEILDRRFIEDDLNTLVELGLLRYEFIKSGKRKFIITRNAVSLINLISNEKNERRSG